MRLSLAILLLACGGPSAPATPELPPPEALDVLAYNVWMLPPVARDRPERAADIPHHLKGYDVVVLSEAFEEAARTTIVTAMTEAGYTATPVLGSSQAPECRRQLGPIEVGIDMGLDGGVVILGRHTLEHVEERIFRPVCAGEDCCSAKGVQYARFRKSPERCVHVFGTHLQNQAPAVGREDPRAVRTQQLQIIRAFIDEAVDQDACPGPVVVAGDLNLLPEDLPEALEILRARSPGELRGPKSWGEHNTYAESDAPEHLDYVLVTEDFDAPLVSLHETRVFRSTHAFTRGSGIIGLQRDGVVADLSDHHAVAGHFEWGQPLAEQVLAVGDCPIGVCSDPPQRLWMPENTPLLCGEHVEGVFCRAGLGAPPCDDPTVLKRCLQIARPDSEVVDDFDDFLCYRRAVGERNARCAR